MAKYHQRQHGGKNNRISRKKPRGPEKRYQDNQARAGRENAAVKALVDKFMNRWWR